MRLLILITVFMLCKLINPNFEIPAGPLAVSGVCLAILDLLSVGK